MMENHDAAYSVWRDAKVKRRVLIHIDAHHDMWWIEDSAETTIANFICPSLKDELIDQVFWVVPDQTWELRASRKAVFRHAKKLASKYPQSQPAIHIDERKISTTVLGKPLTICSVAGLPLLEEAVLLDIDVDYLVIPFVSYGELDTHGQIPWCWPDELLGKLRARGIRSGLTTISYSVEGGYTPLKWKYLGDELKQRLSGADPAGPLLASMGSIRAGAIAACGRDFGVAEQEYVAATRLAPELAASHFHLAEFYLETNRIAEARECYQRAIAIDPSYRTACNTVGVLYQSRGQLQQARSEFERVLQLDSEDPYAHYGMALIAAEGKRWDDAEARLRKSLACDDQLLDVHRTLGRLLTRQGRYDEAIRAYEASIKLALAGHTSFVGPIITDDGEPSIKDFDHCRIHAQLAYLHEMKGETEKAITSYRIGITGYNRPWVRARLARLYLRQGKWRKSVSESWHAARSMPALLKRNCVRIYWRLRRIAFRILDSGLWTWTRRATT